MLSKKHKHNFDKYIEALEEIGYKNYYKVLNAKDYGVPQNRERIFVISIRCDIEQEFEFPMSFDNGIRLKDVLETEVDEKFYISSEKAEKLVTQLKDKQSLLLDMCQAKREGKPRECTDTAPTLAGRDYKEPRLINQGCVPIDKTYNEPKQIDIANCITSREDRGISNRKSEGTAVCIGNVNPSGKGMNGNVYAGNIAPTLTTNKGESQKMCIQCLTPDRLEKRQNGRRFKEDGEPSFTLTGQDRHGVLQIGNYRDGAKFENPQTGRVYLSGGISPTLNTMQGGDRQPKVLIKQATKQGYIECELGGVADLSYPNSATRRGRVQENGSISPTITSVETGICRIESLYRIRKLTPKECFRLMGFADEDFQKCVDAGISNSQLYKQAGNSIVVNVLECIFKNLFKRGATMNIDETVKALRWIARNDEAVFNAEQANIVADQLEQLQAENEQLKASRPVRCGECKHWRMDTEYSVKGFCCNRLGLIEKTKNSDYCSYGGRRDAE